MPKKPKQVRRAPAKQSRSVAMKAAWQRRKQAKALSELEASLDIPTAAEATPNGDAPAVTRRRRVRRVPDVNKLKRDLLVQVLTHKGLATVSKAEEIADACAAVFSII